MYVVTAEKTGFALALVDNVRVQVGARLRVDLQMPVGQVTEKVEVTAAQPLLETDSSQRGQVITGDQTRALPLNGREYSSLALLTTGVKLGGSALTTGNTPREGAFNVNGLRSTFNNFLIDGVDNNAYGTSNQGFSNQVMQPPPDAVGEFKVVTNNMSAEYGRAAGATINVSLPQRHATVPRRGLGVPPRHALNATGFFKPATGKPPLDRNQFGGVLGGPIVKNKAFFFGDYEGLPADAQGRPAFSTHRRRRRSGRASSRVDVRDPRTGVVYPAGTPIPMTAFARKVLAGLPDADRRRATPTTTRSLQEFTERLRQGGRQGRRAGRRRRCRCSAATAGATWTRSISRRFRCRRAAPATATIYARNKQLVLGHDLGRRAARRCSKCASAGRGRRPARTRRRSAPTSALEQFGIPGLPTDPRIAGGLPTQLITGYSDLGRQATNPQWQYPTVYNPKVNYTWLTGAHSFKTGYEFQHIDDRSAGRQPAVRPRHLQRPVHAAGRRRGRTTSTTSPTSCSACARSTRSAACSSPTCGSNMHFAYLQDDWRVERRADAEPRPALRVRDAVLGARQRPVELRSGDQRDGHGEGRLDLPIARWSIPTATTSARASASPTRATPSTVVRGGYGISYVHFNRAGGGDLLPINGPQVVNAVVNQTNPTAPSFVPTEQGYPAGLTDPSQFNPLTANITYMPRDFHSSPVQSWYVSVQREFGRNMLLDVAYVGNRADDLLLFANYNQAAPNNAAGHDPAADAPADSRASRDITYAFNGGKSRYKALQTQVRVAHEPRRDAAQLADAVEGEGQRRRQSLENPNGNFPAPQDFHNLDADFGLSDYHQPYNSTTSFVWSLPFGQRPALGVERVAAAWTRWSAAGSSPASTRITPARR